jgi:PIN domain nuclease of toxin-antitoxin system
MRPRKRREDQSVRVLLDTSALLWWFAGDAKLSTTVRTLLSLADTSILVSAASACEICTKVRIGKLPTARDLCENFLSIIAEHQFEPLAITVEHGRLAGRMAGTHKDPFDRMLAAQALVEDVPLVTNDPAFAAFGVKVVW